MSKALIVYWTSTGNTEKMAEAVKEGAQDAAELRNVSDTSADEAAEYDVLALGCPAQGSEELDSTEFEPFFEELEGKLSGKKVALFGSHDWGDGEWIRTWADRVKEAGAELILEEGIIADNEPDDDVLTECKDLGAQLAEL